MKWTNVGDNEKHGVAIHNFQSSENHCLSLQVGDAVVIIEELEDWYYGCKACHKNERGIFPKCFVARRTSPESKLPLVQEITAVLREWGDIFKQLYVNNSDDFKELERRMYELISLRSAILSGTLPQDELREMEHRVASRIDLGNHLLGMDMVVRDANCNILNPESTSTVQLFWQHQKATEDIKNAENSKQQKQKSMHSSNQFSHSLFLSVRNFVCKISDDVELLMSLYDGKENAPFTESYVVNWSNVNPLHSLRVLFTDLGSRDLTRDKVYLVCQVIRVGAMDLREVEKENRRNTVVIGTKKTQAGNGTMIRVRRPFGVAAMDITLYMSGKMESDEETDLFIPFIPCEKENMEQTLKRALILPKDHKGQGLWVSLKLLHGDLKQVREENPHLVLGNISISRKMGFPEVILPGDVRNDLYLTLMYGEFGKGAKKTDKNVQVSVTVCNEKGIPIPNVIFLGGGVEGATAFRSVVYYHDGKPKWNEIFKVAIPIEEFKVAHIKFTFRHRSSNEAKDKSEKPFAISYVKLMQENGTTLADAAHNLLVYRIDHKKWDDADIGYLSLPWERADVKSDRKDEKCSGLVFSPKDTFFISTNVCSTKLTQNVDLLGLLNWGDNTETLELSLRALMQVDGEEVVKYLQDVLDALFNILMQNSDSELYDDIVFNCLLFIIGLVANRKYSHFQPVLDVYIQESFSATLAYNKLMIVLKSHIDNACNAEEEIDRDHALNVMKSLKYIFRFIVRSRLLFADLNNGRGQDEFEKQLRSLLHSIVDLVSSDLTHLATVRGTCLKYLPMAIEDIMKVFDARELSVIMADLVKSVPHKQVKPKMTIVNDLVRGPLFLRHEARSALLPAVLALLKNHLDATEEGPALHLQTKSAEKLSRVLGASSENWVKAPYCRETEVELCIKVLSDIMELLFRNDIGPTQHDITEVMLTVLRTVIQASIPLSREHPNVAPLVVIMLSIFRQMTKSHYDAYVTHFQTPVDRLDFLTEILLVFKDLVSRPVFPKDWCEMIMLQNSVILKALRFFSHTIRDYFSQPFDFQAWNNFFHCTISFLTQPSLQLERFSTNKQLRIMALYKDMRRETGFEIRSMWFNLGQFKIQFVPGLVGATLEMTLIPEVELRTATIPIFFDMMQCEYYSFKNSSDFYFTKRDSTANKANFNEFENEMIAKLDVLFEGGCGDEAYKDLFRSTMLSLCEQHAAFKTQGVKFVKIVARLMERLLEYRTIITDENSDNRMSCVVKLLDFYSEISRQEMYIRYVNKLCELHLDCDNFTEAAFTLQLHAKLLNWTDDPLSPHLRSQKHSECLTHLELKESLYYDSIEYFNRGKMWECALKLCKELKEQYEEHLFDYNHLSVLHSTMAKFYDNIMKQMRPDSEYFRVGFYGRGFPTFLQNQVFVYRGREYERLNDFSSRILNQFPNAELMNKLEPPGNHILSGSSQTLQINKVDPVMDETNAKFDSKRVPEKILKYYRVNEITRFRYSRPVFIPEGTNDFANMWLERTILNTTYPLPGILLWFPVSDSRTLMISPLENAIEQMKATNQSLQDLIAKHNEDDKFPISPLSMKLVGIVDPAVMGGIANYEKAFFTTEYEEANPQDAKLVEELKSCIAGQVPLVQRGIQIHFEKLTPDLAPLHHRLEECFKEMKANIQSKYGVVEAEPKMRSGPSVRRHLSLISNGSAIFDDRQSIASFQFDSGSSTSLGLKNLIKSPVSISTATLKSKGKEKRKSKISSKDLSNTGTSQWYTGPDISPISTGSTTVFELRQELQPKRPLRSEVEREKRLSRPNSGQWPRSGVPGVRFSQISANRDSTGTTESTTSEEDPTPPPLPVKQKNADYSYLQDNGVSSSPPPPKPPLK